LRIELSAMIRIIMRIMADLDENEVGSNAA
jgi:hypothetical protein